VLASWVSRPGLGKDFGLHPTGAGKPGWEEDSMTTRSLLRCVRCEQVTGDATPSPRDREPRCSPCERRTDHEHRLATGDRWYRERIADYAERLYGPEWERKPGWQFCADLFADARALGGWAIVGVKLPRRRPRLKVTTRPCPVCGETTTSVTNYFCAACHFQGWWGQWRGEVEAPAVTTHDAAGEAAGRSTTWA
jgi:hypothetical protein